MHADDERHGTTAGHAAHRVDGERPCGPCREAYNAYMRDFRSRPDAKRRASRGNRAASRALWRLAALHPAEYEALRLAELATDRPVMTKEDA